MQDKKNKFYVTTPIYYATARPHLGSLYSTLLADVSARWNKQKGKKVFFLTGTDEHGQKIDQAAQKAQMEPKPFVDSFIEAYKFIWKSYHIDYDYFIRTTDQTHVKTVQAWLEMLMQKGDIYKSVYEGWYCTPDEAFLTEKEAAGFTDKSPICPTCNRPTNFISEETYFFKLSAYQDKLLEFFENNPNFVVPKERLNEVIKFVQSGLKDLSISRTTVKWGIPFPGDSRHVAYVWADALLNYISAIGYLDKARQQEFDFYWPADVQVMGKDILRFHAVYWPAFLMASGLKLPKQLLVHGWIKVNQQKMSKSFGNVIDPQVLSDNYGADAVRYYLLSQLAITQDAEFSTQALEQCIESELANDLGNLVNRVIVLALKNDLKIVPKINILSEESKSLFQAYQKMLVEFSQDMDRYHFHLAIPALWRFIAQVNAYFHAHEPWKLAKTDNKKFVEVINITCQSLRLIGNLLWSIMPKKSEELLNHLGLKVDLKINIELLKPDFELTFNLYQGENLFAKIEKLEQKATIPVESVIDEQKPIDITDFAKVQLVVGTIEQCEEISQSDKLYKLQVDFGIKGKRQILSGIKKFFKINDLINKQAVFVFNLAPRKMMGLESQGMLLTAVDEQNNLQLIAPAKFVPNGTMLK